MDRKSFQKDLETLINRHSMENGSDTPDFILAEYLCDCLASFEVASCRRERWYGRGTQVKPAHDSDCATHNSPAAPAGPCDCSQSAK